MTFDDACAPSSGSVSNLDFCDRIRGQRSHRLFGQGGEFAVSSSIVCVCVGGGGGGGGGGCKGGKAPPPPPPPPP